MIIGLLLAVGLTMFVASIGFIVLGSGGAIRDNIFTGAVIGTSQIVSYSFITLIISLIIVFVLVWVIRKNHSRV
ncbi:MAG: hypothetical protein NUV97_01175 [archaeon]|nr:hypothetical protein [archaeon]MCR4323426.1 hypothetical protein [Nanoarchaeota archaeon]